MHEDETFPREVTSLNLNEPQFPTNLLLFNKCKILHGKRFLFEQFVSLCLTSHTLLSIGTQHQHE